MTPPAVPTTVAHDVPRREREGRPGHGAARSRADALRAYFALAELGPGVIAGAAETLGFEWQEPEKQDDGHAESTEATTRESSETPQPGSTAPRVSARPTLHWRPLHLEQPQPEEGESGGVSEVTTPEYVAADVKSSGPPPPAPPIVAPARLRRRLDGELRTPREGSELDVDRLVEQFSRGQALHRLPRRLGSSHARLVLIVDANPRIVPFWDDLLRVAVDLVRRLGAERVRYLPPPSSTRTLPYPAFDPDEVVLALSDLGLYGGAAVRRRWLRHGRRLKAAGATLRALVPCPAWRWPRELERMWECIDWSRPEGSGQRRAPRSLPGGGGGASDALLTLLSPAVRVEPGLLRAVRGLLGEHADLGSEAEVWNHPKVDGASSRSLEMEAELRLAGHAALERRQRLGKGVEAWRLWAEEAACQVLDWHKDWGDVVWATELMHFRACGVPDEVLGEERLRHAEAVMKRADAHAAVEGSGGQPSARATAARAFWRRELARSPSGASKDERFGQVLVSAYRTLRQLDPEVPLPAGVTPAMLAEGGAKDPPRRWTLWQWGDQLRVLAGGEPGQGSPITDVWAREPRLTLGQPGHPSELFDLESEEPELPIPDPTTTLRLVTDLQHLELDPWTLPKWASRAGRDPHGLWAAFEVAGIEQRMRWIPPGRFLMGSPEDEEGRYDDEGPRHEVVLSEGFWLAETPCTQALWEAVMGENPSRFPSARRPVEQVSWNDCQRFFDRLNFRFRDLELHLPSEAEWEHACRAGTEEATWLGALEILGANNAPALDPIAWYGGNSGVGYELEEASDSSWFPEKQFEHDRAGTREVATKASNPWGLYDILGNVREWCEDSWNVGEGYPEGPRIDPLVTEGSGRVSRGGSWGSDARDVRAAFRDGYGPGFRLHYLGFRLSRGPQVGGAQGRESASAVSGAAERGTSRRARSRRSRSWVERLGWAVDGGLDSYGRWVAIEVGGVRHRLRWIYPGTFEMGSPEDEEGRYGWEGPRHEVILTQGFWLGEVPCTQALWEAVMGSNPSRFKTPNRPVERVNWEDCKEFFDQLSKRVPGFVARLPTEAQWEYACRAGTTEATWEGGLKIRGERDAPLLDDLAWYGGNSGVDFDLPDGVGSSGWNEKQYPHTHAGTREVGQKAENPWGLYDMLGNVFEWCEDARDYGSGYPQGPRVDPLGTKGSRRVYRGGSWDSSARDVRAAYRNGVDPGCRYVFLGFRLSRGPEEEWLAEPQAGSGEQPGAADRGTREKPAPGSAERGKRR